MSDWAKFQKERWAKWWRQKVRATDTPFFAQADRTLRPEQVDLDLVGHHTSIVPDETRRVYLFPTEDGQTRFVFKYKRQGAAICKDPWP